MKSEIVLLKSKLCGFEHTARQLNKKANKLKGDKKVHVKLIKRELSLQAREHLIAYALLRFKPYQLIEQKCNENNKPNPQKVLDVIHQHINAWNRREWTLEKVKSLLERKE